MRRGPAAPCPHHRARFRAPARGHAGAQRRADWPRRVRHPADARRYAGAAAGGGDAAQVPAGHAQGGRGADPGAARLAARGDADLAIVSLAHPDDAGIAGVALEAVADEDMVVVEKARTPAPPPVYERGEADREADRGVADAGRHRAPPARRAASAAQRRRRDRLGAGGEDHGAARTGRDHPAGLHAGGRAARRRGRRQRHHGDAGAPHAGARRAELPPSHLGRRGGAPPAWS